MALQQRPQDGELDDLLSSGEPNDRGNSKRICPTSARPFWRVWERVKNLFCSGVFLKASAVAVGLWNPKKSFRSVMMAFVFLLDLFYLLGSVYYKFVCRRFDTPLNTLFCGNFTSSPKEALQGNQLLVVLSVIGNFAVLSSHVAFFWCMWKLGERSEYCVTLDKAYSAAKRSNWVTLNCTMLTFGILLLILLFWLNLSFEEKYSLAYYVRVSLSIIPIWVTLTISWLFALLTYAMKDCVSRCHAEIRNAAHCTTDDIISIHKRLCQQLSSTSEALKIWFVVHFFLLAIVEVFYVSDMVSLFEHAPNWFLFYQCALLSLIFLYVFVYPSYCASSVTVRCSKILKDLNMSTDEEWQTGHPLYSRSQLALFLQYAQFTNCGFQVGHLTFGSSFAWLSTIITVCSLLLKSDLMHR